MAKYILFLIVLIASCKNATEPKIVSNNKNTEDFQSVSTDLLPFTLSLNGAQSQTKLLPNGKIEMTAGKSTDFFIEPGSPPYELSNAPLLLKEVDNTKPFTFSFKTTPQHSVKYDAGMAFIYINYKNWLKFAFEADERMNHRLVTVKTKDFSDDNNHDAIQSPSVYMKISSDTKVVGFYYSIDSKEWQLVRVFKNDYPSVIKVGIGTQSPAGEGNKSLFEEIKFSDQSVKDFRLGL